MKEAHVLEGYLRAMLDTLRRDEEAAHDFLTRCMGPVKLVVEGEGPAREYVPDGAFNLSRVIGNSSCGGAQLVVAYGPVESSCGLLEAPMQPTQRELLASLLDALRRQELARTPARDADERFMESRCWPFEARWSIRRASRSTSRTPGHLAPALRTVPEWAGHAPSLAESARVHDGLRDIAMRR